jgi:DNA invertase Pin-like site-specific DNA recombinase
MEPAVPNEAVAYYRVSTKEQGLGIAGQRTAVERFCRGQYALVGAYEEKESGKSSERPELAKALAHAKRIKATLIIAKLDRLARNVAFIANLMESKVKIRACDLPEANELVLHIMAAIAQNEAKAISDRTKAALAVLKRNGVKLGTHNTKRKVDMRAAQRKGGIATKGKARTAYAGVLPIIRALQAQGMTQAQTASALNAQGHKTRKGGSWTATQIQRVLRYAEERLPLRRSA